MWGDEDVGVEPRVKAAAATPSVGKAQAAPSGISPFAAAAPTATKTWGSDDSSDEEHGASAPRTPHQADEGEEQPSSLLDASTGCTTDFAAGMDMFSKARESAQAAAAAAAAAAAEAAAATAAAAAPVDDFDPFAAPAEDPTAAPAAAAPGALTLEQLSAMPVDAQKNALGNGLYPLILAAVGEPALAGKITGMFLEMEAAALLPLLTAPNVLGAKVQEAVEVLQAHEAAQATATATPAAATAAAAAAAPADSADAVALCVKDLGKALKESNKDKLGRVVAAFGIAEARATLKATQEQEAAGGMMTDAGDRRRSAGGVFFKLLQDAHPAAMKDIITANNKFRKAQGKKGKAGAKGGKVVAPAPGKGTKHGLLGSPEVSQQKRQRTGEPGVAAAAAPGNFPSLFAAVKAGAQ
jgi:hypothetical protein